MVSLGELAIRAVVGELEEYANALDVETEDDRLAELELDDLARLLLRLKSLCSTIALLRDRVEVAVARAMPEKELYVPGVGRLERRVSSSHKWDDRLVAGAVVARALDPDPETGEVPADKVKAALEAVLACGAFSYWRTGELEKLGLEPDKYRETKWGRRTVKILEEAAA